MSGFSYTIHLEADEGDEKAGRIWLIARASNADLQFSHPIYSSTFNAADLHQVLIATPWVTEHEGHLRLKNDVWHKNLADVVEEMLTYFDAPDEPQQRLLEVKLAVKECDVVQESSLEFSIYAYAWLDVMIREDLADEARTAHDIWLNDAISIDCKAVCNRRVEQLTSWHSAAGMRIVGRMAGSVPTREVDESRSTRTG